MTQKIKETTDEQFPSLKKNDTAWYYDAEKNEWLLREKALKKHCQDNQKIKDVIDKLEEDYFNDELYSNYFDNIRKLLGIE